MKKRVINYIISSNINICEITFVFFIVFNL